MFDSINFNIDGRAHFRWDCHNTQFNLKKKNVKVGQ